MSSLTRRCSAPSSVYPLGYALSIASAPSLYAERCAGTTFGTTICVRRIRAGRLCREGPSSSSFPRHQAGPVPHQRAIYQHTAEPAIHEGIPGADRGHCRAGDDRPDSGHAHQPLSLSTPSDPDRRRSAPRNTSCPLAPFGAGRRFSVESDRSVLLGSCRVRGVELPVTLLDSASSFVPGNCDADMVRANSLACGGDLLLRLTCCQGEDPIAEAWRAAVAAS